MEKLQEFPYLSLIISELNEMLGESAPWLVVLLNDSSMLSRFLFNFGPTYLIS